MSLVQVSKFYEKTADVTIYNQTRVGLPDSVGVRIMSETRKKRKAEENEKLDLMIDVGCGGGRHTNLFAPHFKRIVGFDVTELQIQQAREKNKFDHVTYMVGSGEAMPIADKSVDLAIFIFSAFFMDIEKVEKELLRVLKPDGVAVLYGDLVDDINLLDSSDKIVQFSDLSQNPIDLWNDKCINPVTELARKTNAADKRILDRFSSIFEEIRELHKEKINFSYREKVTLEELIGYYYPGIPLFRKYVDLQKINPFDEFARELKKLWGIPQMENKDISLSVARGSFMILLDNLPE